MTIVIPPDQAMRRLAFHATPEDGAFLAMLRPYRALEEHVLVDVMESLEACAPLLRADELPRELVAAVWAISHLGRLWALTPDGMLQRNKLIDDASIAKLAAFLDAFDMRVLELLAPRTES